MVLSIKKEVLPQGEYTLVTPSNVWSTFAVVPVVVLKFSGQALVF